MIRRLNGRLVLGLTRIVFRYLDNQFRLGDDLRTLLLPSAVETRVDSKRLEIIRADVWHLHALFKSAVGSGLSEELVAILNKFSKNSDQIQRAVLVWIDLIEVLVSDVEVRYGSKSGNGKIKTAEVKQVLSALAQSGKISLPFCPPSLQPLIFDVVIDSVIDMIVLQMNQYDLWEAPGKPRDPINQWWQSFRLWLRGALLRLAEVGGRLFMRLRNLFRRPLTLSPGVQAALEAVQREGLIAGEQGIVETASRLMIWVGTHRNELVKTSELVFGAVQEAETFRSLTGPEKKEYAREMIWLVLEDMGFDPQSNLMTAILDSMIDLIIESSVQIFNKRGFFGPSGKITANVA